MWLISSTVSVRENWTACWQACAILCILNRRHNGRMQPCANLRSKGLLSNWLDGLWNKHWRQKRKRGAGNSWAECQRLYWHSLAQLCANAIVTGMNGTGTRMPQSHLLSQSSAPAKFWALDTHSKGWSWLCCFILHSETDLAWRSARGESGCNFFLSFSFSSFLFFKRFKNLVMTVLTAPVGLSLF